MKVRACITILATIIALPCACAQESSTFDPKAQCLQALAQSLSVETRRMQNSLGLSEDRLVDWNTRIELAGRIATVVIGPITEPSMRGGGGRYEFNCDTAELRLIEGFR